ncbi:MAG: SIR2 family protein [Fibromonadales bacterium]|nr:SIR2 family protein [Fibromonadales bacterium]
MISIDEVVEKLAAGELSVFIGAGASKSYKDAPGVPSAGEMVEIFAKKFSYISDMEEYKNCNLRFEIACQKIRDINGDRDLIDILCKEMNDPNIKPLPAHKLLARLPFNSYFTTNFDRLLEIAFSNFGDIVHPIIKDKDVAFWKSNKKPIVKLHGCINNRESIVAAIEDYKPFKETKPLIDSLSKTILASKTILFVGFALQDDDFKELYRELESLLGEYMAGHMAVVINPTNADVQYWQKRGITLLDRDLTDFLNGLAFKFSNLPELEPSLLNNPYLKKLHEVTNCPTETMATNVFLDMLGIEIDSDWELDIIINDFRVAAEVVFKEKPNFLAFKKECDEIVAELSKCQERIEMKGFLDEKLITRKLVGNQINKHAKWIRAASQILLYSQSVRVIEFLKSVPKQIQQSCTLYICECRIKSPEPFYDAKQICENLKNTDYTKHIILDSSVTYLMKTNQVQSVLMGAHAVYVSNGKLLKFVNTSGSDMIIRESEKYQIPLFVIAEKKKTKEWEKDLEKEVKYTEGNFITREFKQKEGVGAIEIAYDLCDRTPNMRFICEDGLDA